MHNLLTNMQEHCIHTWLKVLEDPEEKVLLEHLQGAMYTGHQDEWKNWRLIYKIHCFIMYNAQ